MTEVLLTTDSTRRRCQFEERRAHLLRIVGDVPRHVLDVRRRGVDRTIRPFAERVRPAQPLVDDERLDLSVAIAPLHGVLLERAEVEPLLRVDPEAIRRTHLAEALDAPLYVLVRRVGSLLHRRGHPIQLLPRERLPVEPVAVARECDALRREQRTAPVRSPQTITVGVFVV